MWVFSRGSAPQPGAEGVSEQGCHSLVCQLLAVLHLRVVGTLAPRTQGLGVGQPLVAHRGCSAKAQLLRVIRGTGRYRTGRVADVAAQELVDAVGAH